MAFAYSEEEKMVNYLKELDVLQKKNGLRKPIRSFLDKDGIKWRSGKPNYERNDYHYLNGKTQNHPEGSLEVVVEDLVKTFEMEIAHKLDLNQIESVDNSNGGFQLSVNGIAKVNLKHIVEGGIYNSMMNQSPNWDWKNSTFEESHEIFKKAFKAFPFEILKVFSGPPKVAFTWRHWAEFVGEYKGNKGNGELLELIGFGIADVNDKLQIKELAVYFERENFFEVLAGKKPAQVLKDANLFIGDIKCPFASKLT